jgi:hypothetical protein
MRRWGVLVILRGRRCVSTVGLGPTAPTLKVTANTPSEWIAAAVQLPMFERMIRGIASRTQLEAVILQQILI